MRSQYWKFNKEGAIMQDWGENWIIWEYMTFFWQKGSFRSEKKIASKGSLMHFRYVTLI